MGDVTYKRKVVGKGPELCNQKIIELIDGVAEKCLSILGHNRIYEDIVLNFNIKKSLLPPGAQEWMIHYAQDDSYFPESFSNIYQIDFVHLAIIPLCHFNEEGELKVDKNSWWIVVSCYDASICEWASNGLSIPTKVPVPKAGLADKLVDSSKERCLDVLEFVGEQLIRDLSSSQDFTFATIPECTTRASVGLLNLRTWHKQAAKDLQGLLDWRKAMAKAFEPKKPSIEEDDDQAGLGNA